MAGVNCSTNPLYCNLFVLTRQIATAGALFFIPFYRTCVWFFFFLPWYVPQTISFYTWMGNLFFYFFFLLNVCVCVCVCLPTFFFSFQTNTHTRIQKTWPTRDGALKRFGAHTVAITTPEGTNREFGFFLFKKNKKMIWIFCCCCWWRRGQDNNKKKKLAVSQLGSETRNQGKNSRSKWGVCSQSGDARQNSFSIHAFAQCHPS